MDGATDDEGDDNTYDYDDSFLDDDAGYTEDDDSEDKDFIPSDNEEVDEKMADEELSELISEARGIVDG